MISAPKASPDTRQSQAIVLMLLAAFAFSAMDALAKALIGAYPAIQVVWARFAGQLVLVVAVLAVRGQIRQALTTRHPMLHLVRSVLQLATITLFFTSLRHVGLAEAQALTEIAPVLITLGAALFLGEGLGRRRLFGVVAALLGALLIVRPGLGVFSPMALLPLAAAVTYAGNVLITRKVGRQETVWASLVYAAAFGMLASGAFLPALWVPVAMHDVPLFALTGLCGAVAQLCLVRAFSLTEAAVLAPFGYSGLIFATAWGALFFAEVPDGMTVLGALVIVSAGLYVWHRETRSVRAAQSPDHHM